MKRLTLTIWLISFFAPAYATTLDVGEIPAMFALKELCDKKFLGSKAKNTHAFTVWRALNLHDVNQILAQESFYEEKELYKKFVFLLSSRKERKQACKDFESLKYESANPDVVAHLDKDSDLRWENNAVLGTVQTIDAALHLNNTQVLTAVYPWPKKLRHRKSTRQQCYMALVKTNDESKIQVKVNQYGAKTGAVEIVAHHPGYYSDLKPALDLNDDDGWAAVAYLNLRKNKPESKLVFSHFNRIQQATETCNVQNQEQRNELATFLYDIFLEADKLAVNVDELTTAVQIGDKAARIYEHELIAEYEGLLTIEQIKLIFDDRVTDVIAYENLKKAVQSGDTKRVKALIDSGIDPTLDDGWSWSLFNHAMEGGHYDIALTLLHQGDIISNTQTEYYLRRALSGDIPNQLIGPLLDIAHERRIKISFPEFLHKAANSGNNFYVEKLLKIGADPNIRHGKHYVLKNAVQSARNNTDLVGLLLKYGAEPNVLLNEQSTLLIDTIQNYKNKTDMVRLLLEAGADPNKWNGYGHTPLVSSIGRKNYSMYELLVSNGADINLTTINKNFDFGRSSLGVAIERGEKEIAHDLIARNFRIEGANGLDAIRSAIRAGDWAIDLLESEGVGVSDEHIKQMANAAAQRRPEMIIDYIIKQEDRFGSENKLGVSPLLAAVNANDMDIVKRLLRIGVDTETRDSDGYTAFLRACENGFDIARSLVEYGVDMNVTNHDGDTGLIIAARSGQLGVVELLLEAGANVNAVNNNGYTPLIAVVNSRLTGEYIGIPEEKLHKNVHAMHQYDLWLNRPSHERRFLSEHSEVKITTQRIKIGTQFSHMGTRTEIRRLAYPPSLSLVEYLLENGADPDIQEHEYSSTALMWATAIGSKEIAQSLIAAGADPTTRNIVGKNALDIGRDKEYYAVVRLLERTMNAE